MNIRIQRILWGIKFCKTWMKKSEGRKASGKKEWENIQKVELLWIGFVKRKNAKDNATIEKHRVKVAASAVEGKESVCRHHSAVT